MRPCLIAKDVADLGRQRFHGERLCDHRHAVLKESRSQGCVLSIAGHEKNLLTRTKLSPGVRDLSSVQARQSDVSDQKVDTPLGLEDLQPFEGCRQVIATMNGAA